MRRKISMQRWVSLWLVSLATPAFATEHSVIGTWCEIGGYGEVLYLEKDGIAFNEHTVCEAADPVPEAGSFSTVLACKNIYFDDGEAVEAFQRSFDFSAVLTAEARMTVTTGDPAVTQQFGRCD